MPSEGTSLKSSLPTFDISPTLSVLAENNGDPSNRVSPLLLAFGTKNNNNLFLVGNNWEKLEDEKSTQFLQNVCRALLQLRQ